MVAHADRESLEKRAKRERCIIAHAAAVSGTKARRAEIRKRVVSLDKIATATRFWHA